MISTFVKENIPKLLIIRQMRKIISFILANLYGMDETRAIIKTAGTPGIIYESQLPKHMKSIEKIREMEASWQV